MATFSFENAALKLFFETGVNELGKTIVTSKTYRNIRSNVDASQVALVVQAISSLSNYPLQDAQKIETETIEF